MVPLKQILVATTFIDPMPAARWSQSSPCV
jgi:hypothetical protein